MNRFFVGQRVRKIVAPNLGCEGVVVGLGPYPVGWQDTGTYVDNPTDLRIQHASDWQNVRGEWVSASVPSQTQQWKVEPILPEGHRASDFANVIDLLDSLKRTQRNPDEVAA